MNIKGKKVLVTGADGFIGSHLVEALLKEGCTVRALSYYNSFNFLGWIEDIDGWEKLDIVTGDVRDPHFCVKLVKDIDIVFHLAALIGIPYSYLAPDAYVDTNIKGTLNICQASMNEGVKHLICTSTSEVYGSAIYVPIDEKHPLQPQSPYSATKIGADAIAMSFYLSFKMPVTIARPFNTYGPRQSARAIIPTIITQIASGQKQVKVGDMKPIRDFNYVKDTCEGFISIAKNSTSIGETLNIGSGVETSVGDVAVMIKKLMNSKVEFVTDKQRIRPKDSEVQRLLCDNRKLKVLTGFEPKYNLSEGLQETIDWFVKEDNLKKYKPGMYNV